MAANGGTGCNGGGCGTIFTVTAGGTESIIHDFKGQQGLHPYSGLMRDGHGNLHGTAFYGFGDGNGTGTAFKLRP